MRRCRCFASCCGGCSDCSRSSRAWRRSTWFLGGGPGRCCAASAQRELQLTLLRAGEALARGARALWSAAGRARRQQRRRARLVPGDLGPRSRSRRALHARGRRRYVRLRVEAYRGDHAETRGRRRRCSPRFTSACWQLVAAVACRASRRCRSRSTTRAAGPRCGVARDRLPRGSRARGRGRPCGRPTRTAGCAPSSTSSERRPRCCA